MPLFWAEVAQFNFSLIDDDAPPGEFDGPPN